MKTGCRIHFDNYQTIKTKVLELILQAGPLPTKGHLYYLDDKADFTKDRFKLIPELKEEMIRLGWWNYWINTAVVVIYEDGMPIHKDTVDPNTPDYSLLVPIQNTKNTYTVFYDTENRPTKSVLAEGVSYFWYPPEVCREIDRFESTEPTLINIKTPHNVINQSPIQPRVLITLRLDSSFSTDLIPCY